MTDKQKACLTGHSNDPKLWLNRSHLLFDPVNEIAKG